jgi:hypothetical protein
VRTRLWEEQELEGDRREQQRERDRAAALDVVAVHQHDERIHHDCRDGEAREKVPAPRA